ncbi:MAG: EF-Tu/IF-2/RF-3 family GTPase [Acidimicrobiales bacterium]
MTAPALTCPHCGARLSLDGDRCRFCGERVDPSTTPGLPPAAATPFPVGDAFSMTVEDVFVIKKRGTVVTGRVEAGAVHVGDALVVEGAGGSVPTRCAGIEMFRKKVEVAQVGDTVGLRLDGVDRDQVQSGDRLRAG